MSVAPSPRQRIELTNRPDTGRARDAHFSRNGIRNDAARRRTDRRPGGRAVRNDHGYFEGFERTLVGAVDAAGPVQPARAAVPAAGSLADVPELRSVELVDRREKRVADDGARGGNRADEGAGHGSYGRDHRGRRTPGHRDPGHRRHVAEADDHHHGGSDPANVVVVRERRPGRGGIIRRGPESPAEAMASSFRG